MNTLQNMPLAAAGLISYRAQGRFGYIMIGAKDHNDAWREAKRSSDMAANLEVWDGERYMPVPVSLYLKSKTDS